MLTNDLKKSLDGFKNWNMSVGLSEDKTSIMVSGEDMAENFGSLEEFIKLGEMLLKSHK